jgi:hypothetical protein
LRHRLVQARNVRRDSRRVCHVRAYELGRPDAARRLLDELARDGFAALPRNGNWLPSFAMLAEVCDLVGVAPAAVALHALLAPHADVSVVVGTCTAVLGPVTRYLGLAALAAGCAGDAVRHLENAIARCRRLGAPIEEARAALGLARALEAEGAAGKAAALRRQAVTTATRLGLAGVLAHAGGAQRPGAPPAPVRRASLRHEGDYWTIRCGNEVTRIKDAKGFVYLDTLLRHPGTEFHALDLARGNPEHRSAAVHAPSTMADRRPARFEPSRTAAPCSTRSPAW